MSKCTTIACDMDAYGDSDRCILHCEKSNYQDDRHKIGFLETFYQKLIIYIIDSVKDFIEGDTEALNKYLSQEEVNVDGPEATFFTRHTVNFKYIHFPERDSRDYYDYRRTLEKLGEIYFIFCEFKCNGLDLKNSKVFFDECTFHNRWYLYNHKILESVRNVLYQVCTFNNSVNTVVADYDSPVLENPIFSDCIFHKDITLENVDIKSALFKNTEYKPLPMKKIEIINCTLIDNTILNNYEIEEFNCIGSEFNEKFEFKQNKAQSFLIDETNFHKLVDCYETTFEKCRIHKSIFDDFVGFEDCTFGKADNKLMNTAEFIYATFLSFINFRNAKFLNGLDLKRINVKGIPNFYNVFIEPINTDRETFRRVKDSFDKVGNFIDANNFYVHEMKKLKEELKTTNQRSKKHLLYLYEITSNYGQSFTRPLVGLFLSAIIYWLLVLGYENNILYSISADFNKSIESLAYILNGIAKAILPFSKVLKQGMESVSFLFYIIFTSFMWLVILAIKRSTKR
jgi:hypothetical protein